MSNVIEKVWNSVLGSGLTLSLILSIMLTAMLTGCGENDKPADVASGPSEAGQAMLLANEPANAMSVREVFESQQQEGKVVVVGRIGGSRNPWVDGLSAFTFTDLSLTACSEIEGDKCKTPWDFCCDPDLKSNTLLVQMVSPDGELLEGDARQLLGVTELDTVVVEAELSRDDAGLVTLSARKLFIR